MIYTKEMVEAYIEQWRRLGDNTDVSLRQWFYFMTDNDYYKYVIRNEYE